MILLVVDTQKGCFDERLYEFEKVGDNIKQLISVAREKSQAFLKMVASGTFCIFSTHLFVFLFANKAWSLSII